MHDYVILKPPLDDFLEHHGVKGMRWGHRKQKYSVKTYNKYKKAGMSEEEAKNQAIKKRRIAKIIGISAGVAAAGLAAYGTYKFMNSPVRKDIVLRAGTKMQTLHSKPDILDGHGHDFHYAAFKKADKIKYKAYEGKELLGDTFDTCFSKKNLARRFEEFTGSPSGPRKFNFQSKVVRNSKIASQKSAIEAFRKLAMDDPEFVKAVNSGTKGTIIKDISKMSKKDWKKAHGSFDADITNLHGTKAASKYFGKLKSLGYSGVVDTNDLTGHFKAKAPVMMFDTSSYVKDGVAKKLTDSEIAKARVGVFLRKAIGVSVPIGVAGAGAAGISSAAKYDNRVINKYKQQNKKKVSK